MVFFVGEEVRFEEKLVRYFFEAVKKYESDRTIG